MCVTITRKLYAPKVHLVLYLHDIGDGCCADINASHVSFILWAIACVLSAGVGIFNIILGLIYVIRELLSIYYFCVRWKDLL